jgi:uncharacterized alpha/beta hydrolase family protein
MKNKSTKVRKSDSNQKPQNLWQAVCFLFWPLNSWLKKVFFVVIIILVASFTLWVSLPERTKTEVIDYLKGSKKTQSPAIVTHGKESSANIQKDIRQHTEGNQSPAVVSNKDVNISIGSKDSKK